MARSKTIDGLKDAVRHARRENNRCIRCGADAKWRGDRPGDHEMGSMWHWYCDGDDCRKYPLPDNRN